MGTLLRAILVEFILALPILDLGLVCQVITSSNLGILVSHTFTNGVTLMTVGTGVSVTATDTVTGSIAGSQTGITRDSCCGVVNVVISPSGSSVTAGSSQDLFGNGFRRLW